MRVNCYASGNTSLCRCCYPITSLSKFYFFVVGGVFVIISEYIYLSYEFSTVRRIKVFQWTVLMNLASTIIGAILFPLLLAAIGIIGVGPLADSPVGQILFPIGTWIMATEYPFQWLALVSTGVGFVATYFLTVYIEFKVLLRLTKNVLIIEIPILKRHVYNFNAISYGVLIIYGGIIWAIYLR